MNDQEKLAAALGALRAIGDIAVEPGADAMPAVRDMQSIATDAVELIGAADAQAMLRRLMQARSRPAGC